MTVVDLKVLGEMACWASLGFLFCVGRCVSQLFSKASLLCWGVYACQYRLSLCCFLSLSFLNIINLQVILMYVETRDMQHKVLHLKSVAVNRNELLIPEWLD